MRWLLVAAALGAFLTLSTITGTLAALSGTPTATGATSPSPTAIADIPPDYLRLYRAAAQEHGIDWAILAAIGKVESDHGRDPGSGVQSGANSAGAMGPMQFLGSTWEAYGVDGNDDGKREPYDPRDAIPAAAAYLTVSGAPGDYRAAIYSYNHADWYVDKVLEQAARYRAAATTSTLRPVGGGAKAVLGSNRIQLDDQMRSDIGAGRIDARVLALLATIARGHTVAVASLLRPGAVTVNGSASNHSFGRAVDIGAIDGEPCSGSRTGACGRLAVALAKLTGPLHSTELIYCFDPDPASADAFAAADHCDHIHVGWDG